MALNSPPVSVIIPSHSPKRRDSLTRAITSAFNQTHLPLEVIVVGDGLSATHVVQLPERFSDSRLRIVHLSERGGQGAARNAGASAARGEYLAFLDDDDEWMPNKLEVQMRLAAEEPEAAVVFCDAHFMGKSDRSTLFQMVGFRGVPSEEAICHEGFVLCSTAVVKRSVFHEMGAFDASPEMWGVEDADLWSRILHAPHKIVFSPLPLVVYNRRSDNYGDTGEFHQHLIHFIHKHLRLFSDRPRCVAALRRRLARILLYNLHRCLSTGKCREARRAIQEAIRHHPMGLKNYAYLLFTFLPPSAYTAARRLKQALWP